LHYYGGNFYLPVEYVSSLINTDVWVFRKSAGFLVAFFGAYGTFKLTNLIVQNYWVSLWAALMLLTLPSYFGHSFINGKDIPFAAGYIWCLYFLSKALMDVNHSKSSVWLSLGICIGLIIGIRVGGFIIVCYLVVFSLMLFFSKQFYVSSYESKNYYYKIICYKYLLCFLSAYVVAIIFWPAALLEPISFPIKAFMKMVDFTDYPNYVLFRGKQYYASELPWYYLAFYLVAKITPPLLVLIFSGFFTILSYYSLNPSKKSSWPTIVVLFGALFPIIYTTFSRPNIYDGIRHFLFVLPPLCVISAIGAEKLIRVIDTKRNYYIVALLSLSLLYQIHALFRYHPYQYIYYSPIVGGVNASKDMYELDYWGISLARLVRNLVLNENLTPASRKNVDIHICGPEHLINGYFDYYGIKIKNVNGDAADYVVVLNRFGCLQHWQQRLRKITDIRLNGAILSAVYSK
jgi:hypothetical protein